MYGKCSATEQKSQCTPALALYTAESPSSGGSWPGTERGLSQWRQQRESDLALGPEKPGDRTTHGLSAHRDLGEEGPGEGGCACLRPGARMGRVGTERRAVLRKEVGEGHLRGHLGAQAWSPPIRKLLGWMWRLTLQF